MQLIKKAHGDTYDYSKVRFTGAHKPVRIICQEHGEFKQSPSTHSRGHGCPKCAPNYVKKAIDYVDECTRIHKGKYTYPSQDYETVHDKIIIICPHHGEFKLRAYAHKQGQGCYKCGRTSSAIANRMPEKEFKNRVKAIYGEVPKYKLRQDFSEVSNPKLYAYCKIHGKVKTTARDFLYSSHYCAECRKQLESKPQRAAGAIAESLTKAEVLSNYRLKNNKQIDVYIPKYKIGIEVNGLYWHDEHTKSRSYHQKKSLQAQKQGIFVMHFWDYEVNEKPDLVTSMMKNALGKSTRVYARNTKVREISSASANQFLEANHIQGKCKSKIKYGLFLGDELLSVMTFDKPRFDSKYDWELIRFATKLGHSVVGGASKLLKAFEVSYNPASILSYANFRISKGNVYETLGFTRLGLTTPNYFYYKGKVKVSRYAAQKSKLKKLLAKYDPDLSERDNLKLNGYNRVFDCGNIVYAKHFSRKPQLK